MARYVRLALLLVVGVLWAAPPVYAVLSPIRSIQYGCATTNTTLTISSVVTGATLVNVTGTVSTGTTTVQASGARATLTNATTVTVDSTAAGLGVCVEVIEFQPFFIKSKQEFSISMAGTGTGTATLSPAVVVAKSIMGHRGYLGTGSDPVAGIQNASTKLTLTNTTTVTATRVSNNVTDYPTVYGTILELR